MSNMLEFLGLFIQAGEFFEFLGNLKQQKTASTENRISNKKTVI